MPVSARDRAAYRADEKHNHTLLTDEERERIFKVFIHSPWVSVAGVQLQLTVSAKAHLPIPNDQSSVQSRATNVQRRTRLGVRRFLGNQIHVLVFAILHGVFSLYIRIRQFWHVVCYQFLSVLYYHHGTPDYIRRDVMGMKRRPNHLSIILRVAERQRVKTDLERLIDETAEIATWCACAQIPLLSVYEKTGAKWTERLDVPSNFYMLMMFNDASQVFSKDTCHEYTKQLSKNLPFTLEVNILASQ